MFGGIARVAFNMAAYSFSHAATRGLVSWSVGAFRNTVSTLVKRGGKSGTVGRYLASMDREVSSGVSALREQAKTFQRSFSAPTARLLRNTMASVKDEAYTLPMNYIYYRMQKNQAVTPEEKEQTKNFSKFYFGVPMVASIGTGIAMRRMRIGRMAKRAAISVAKRIPESSTQRIIERLKPVIGTRHRGLQAVTDRMVAASRARHSASSGRGILSLIATNSPGKVISRLRGAYSSELDHLLRTPDPLHSLKDTLRSLEKDILSDSRIGKSTTARKQLDKQLSILRTGEIDSYRKHFSKSGPLRFMNYVARASGNKNLRMSYTEGRVDFEGFHTMAPMSYGKVTLGGRKDSTGTVTGGTQFDFGTLGVGFMKDSLIRGLTQNKVSRWFLGLFGQAENVRYRESVNSLLTAYKPVTSPAMLNLGRSYVAEGDKTVQDVMLDVLGIDASRLNAKGAQSVDRFSSFMKTRVDAILDGYGIPRKDNYAVGRDLLSIALAKGQFPLSKGDVLVHSGSGELSVMATVKEGKHGSSIKTLMKVGGIGEGEYLKFKKFETSATSSTAKIIRDMHGALSVPVSYRDMNGSISREHIVMGPGSLPEQVPEYERAGFMRWLTDTFEIGKGETEPFPRKAKTAFTKHTNPGFLPTLLDWMKHPDARNSLYANQRSTVDLADVLIRSARQSALDFTVNLVEKKGGRDGAVDVLESIIQKLNLPDVGHGIPAHRLFIRDHDIVNAGSLAQRGDFKGGPDALSKVRAALDLLRGTDAQRGVGEGITRDLTIHDGLASFFNNVRGRISHVPKGAASPTAVNLLAVESPETIFNAGIRARGHLTGRTQYIDEYNANILTVLLSYSHDIQKSMPEFRQGIEWFSNTKTVHAMWDTAKDHAVGDKEISAFMATSHLSKLHHHVASTFNAWLPDLDPTNAETLRNRIGSVIATFNGSPDYKEVVRYVDNRWRYKSYLPTGNLSELKTRQSPFDQVYGIPAALPENLRTSVGRGRAVLPIVGEIEVATGIMDASNATTLSLMRAFNRTANEILGVGFDEANTPTVGSYFQKMLTKRVLPLGAMMFGYSALDRLADKYLEGTPFGEGLTVFGANVLAGTRLAAQNIMDLTHITDVSKYLEDLLPGIISSPASGLVRGVGPALAGLSLGYRSAGSRGALTGGIIGGAVGALVGGGPLGIFGEWNISKSRKEIVKEYLGQEEVPIRKGRWWELGSTPFEGTRIQYYRPHMYHLLRSKYKEVPGLKDSLLTEYIGAIAPDVYAMKNYYSRPYPVTAGLLSDIPVFSNMMSMLPGFPLLGGIPLHGGIPNGLPSQPMIDDRGGMGAGMFQNYGDTYIDTGAGWSFNNKGMITEQPTSRSALDAATSETVGNIKDIVGLRGFIAGSAFSEMTGRNDVFDYAPELASPVDIAGVRRSYWDLEIGGMLGASEILRRYLPRRRPQVEVFNPLRNTMPVWLPGKDYMIDFQHGDPYTAVPLGEARLPGISYETLKDVELAFPVESEMIGESLESQVAYFLGYPEYMHARNKMKASAEYVAESIRENAKEYGTLLKGVSGLYNPKYDVHAVADAVIKVADGSRMPVRVVPRGFAGESDLNTYLTLANIDKGLLIEVDPDSGATAERSVTRDVLKFKRDLEQSMRSQEHAASEIRRAESQGRSYNLSNAYSWLDRFKILADVAPYSPEYREASAVVDQQVLSGTISPHHTARIEKIKGQVAEKQKAYNSKEYRFLYLGESMSEKGRALDEFYYQEYSMPERMAGAAWERITHLRNPLQRKLMNSSSALEEYELTSVFGKGIKQWQNPISDFAASYYYQGINVDDPMQGALSWGSAGMLLGGAPVAGAMALMGIGTAAFNSVTGGVRIPERVQERRELQEQYDAYMYARYINLYDSTGDSTYKSLASRTMTGAAMGGGVLSASSAKSAIPSPDRAYIQDIIDNLKLSQVGRVTQILPQPAVAALYSDTGNMPLGKQSMIEYENKVLSRGVPSEPGYYNESLSPSSLMINSMKNEGVEAHDAGFGWYSQLADMERSKRLGTFTEEMDIYGTRDAQVGVREFLKGSTIQAKIRELLRPVSSGINIVDDGRDVVDVDIIVRT